MAADEPKVSQAPPRWAVLGCLLCCPSSERSQCPFSRQSCCPSSGNSLCPSGRRWCPTPCSPACTQSQPGAFTAVHTSSSSFTGLKTERNVAMEGGRASDCICSVVSSWIQASAVSIFLLMTSTAPPGDVQTQNTNSLEICTQSSSSGCCQVMLSTKYFSKRRSCHLVKVTNTYSYNLCFIWVLIINKWCFLSRREFQSNPQESLCNAEPQARSPRALMVGAQAPEHCPMLCSAHAARIPSKKEAIVGMNTEKNVIISTLNFFIKWTGALLRTYWWSISAFSPWLVQKSGQWSAMSLMPWASAPSGSPATGASDLFLLFPGLSWSLKLYLPHHFLHDLHEGAR